MTVTLLRCFRDTRLSSRRRALWGHREWGQHGSVSWTRWRRRDSKLRLRGLRYRAGILSRCQRCGSQRCWSNRLRGLRYRAGIFSRCRRCGSKLTIRLRGLRSKAGFESRCRRGGSGSQRCWSNRLRGLRNRAGILSRCRRCGSKLSNRLRRLRYWVVSRM